MILHPEATAPRCRVMFSQAVPEKIVENPRFDGAILPGHRDDLQHMRLGVGRAGR